MNFLLAYQQWFCMIILQFAPLQQMQPGDQYEYQWHQMKELKAYTVMRVMSRKATPDQTMLVLQFETKGKLGQSKMYAHVSYQNKQWFLQRWLRGEKELLTKPKLLRRGDRARQHGLLLDPRYAPLPSLTQKPASHARQLSFYRSGISSIVALDSRQRPKSLAITVFQGKMFVLKLRRGTFKGKRFVVQPKKSTRLKKLARK